MSAASTYVNANCVRRLWFPMFSFFESKTDGPIPNEFEWPITVGEVAGWLGKAADTFRVWSGASRNYARDQSYKTAFRPKSFLKIFYLGVIFNDVLK
jgi:hypothetical protein